MRENFYHLHFLLILCGMLMSVKVMAVPPAYQVGVLYWSMDIPCQLVMRQGVEDTAELLNKGSGHTGIKRFTDRKIELLPYVAGNGESGIERQIVQMENLVEQGVDLIIVQPTDNAALSQALIHANEKNIPVVAYDQYISGGKLHSFITSDNYQAGYLDGEYIASLFPDNVAIKLVMVDYPHVSSTVLRVDGFIDALTNQQQSFDVLATYNAVEKDSGARAARQILEDFPEPGSIDVVFTVNDGGGIPVMQALAKAGRNEIKLATVDGDPQSLSFIKKQKITVIDSAQFCHAMGAEAMLSAASILQGHSIAEQKLIPVFPVTFETYPLYPGWTGDIPESFNKPWPSKTPQWSNTIKQVNH